MPKNKTNTNIKKQASEYGQINEKIKKVVPPAPNIYDDSDKYQK